MRLAARRIEYAAALLMDVLGAGVLLLVSTQYWQRIVTPRGRPFTDDILKVQGRVIDSAPTALALVALAGVVAVLATRGMTRRVLGALILLAGAGLIWRSASAIPAVSTSRALALVREKHPRVSVSSTVVPHVITDSIWGALSIGCGVLVLLGGLLIMVRGAEWGAMSTRYEAPGARNDDPVTRHRADAALWGALDRGEDPTERDPRDTR